MKRQGFRKDSIWTTQSQQMLKQLVERYNEQGVKIKWVQVARELTMRFYSQIKQIVNGMDGKHKRQCTFTNAECRRKYKNRLQMSNTVNSKQIQQNLRIRLIQLILQGKSWKNIIQEYPEEFGQFSLQGLKNLFKRSIYSYVLNLREALKDDEELQNEFFKEDNPNYYKEISEKYFRSPQLLRQYLQCGIKILKFFEELKNRKIWRKQNKDSCQSNYFYEQEHRKQETILIKNLYCQIKKAYLEASAVSCPSFQANSQLVFVSSEIATSICGSLPSTNLFEHSSIPLIENIKDQSRREKHTMVPQLQRKELEKNISHSKNPPKAKLAQNYQVWDEQDEFLKADKLRLAPNHSQYIQNDCTIQQDDNKIVEISNAIFGGLEFDVEDSQ